MIDVDFRYVMRTTTVQHGDDEWQEIGPVLQWRKKIDTGKLAQIYEWTEWQDVRTEEE